MTTRHITHDTRDEVLFAFHQACERPTADDIVEWTTRYPQFADDIRAHAAIARDWDARKSAPVLKPDESMLARGYSRALNAIYNAQVSGAATESAQSRQSFAQIMAVRGKDVPSLARKLDVARSVLADLFNGGTLPPIGERLVDAITRELEITIAAFNEALQCALSSPHLGHAKADQMPTIIPRSYEQVIRTSNMSGDRIKYWLSED